MAGEEHAVAQDWQAVYSSVFCVLVRASVHVLGVLELIWSSGRVGPSAVSIVWISLLIFLWSRWRACVAGTSRGGATERKGWATWQGIADDMSVSMAAVRLEDFGEARREGLSQWRSECCEEDKQSGWSLCRSLRMVPLPASPHGWWYNGRMRTGVAGEDARRGQGRRDTLYLHVESSTSNCNVSPISSCPRSSSSLPR